MMKNMFELKHSTPSLIGRVRGGSLYLRQALALIREDKQFSFIYIAGTAVAIASALVVALVWFLVWYRKETNKQ